MLSADYEPATHICGLLQLALHRILARCLLQRVSKATRLMHTTRSHVEGGFLLSGATCSPPK